MIRSATPSEEAAAIAVVVLAFASDPVTRWSWPDPARIPRALSQPS